MIVDCTNLNLGPAIDAQLSTYFYEAVRAVNAQVLDDFTDGHVKAPAEVLVRDAGGQLTLLSRRVTLLSLRDEGFE